MLKRVKTWISSAHRGFVIEGVHQNTLLAYRLAAEKGADMIETDARTTKDGILIANHDPDIKGFDKNGNPISCLVSETEYSVISEIRLTNGSVYDNRVPTLEETLSLAYFTGMCVNIDLKEGFGYAEKVAELVAKNGLKGRVVYATNGTGSKTIHKISEIDPEAKFIDTKLNFTREKLSDVKDYPSKCFAYTSDFSDKNIAEIRESGCMLATISLSENNADDAFRHHPDMAEYLHTSDFEKIDAEILKRAESTFPKYFK